MYYDVTKHYQYRTADGRHTGSEKNSFRILVRHYLKWVFYCAEATHKTARCGRANSESLLGVFLPVSKNISSSGFI